MSKHGVKFGSVTPNPRYVADPGGYHWGYGWRLASGYQQVKSVEEGGLREIMRRGTPGAARA